MTTQVDREVAEAGIEVSSKWWIVLGMGILWVIYGFIVLNATARSVWAVALLFGFGFVVGGTLQLMVGFADTKLRWWNIIFGLIQVAAGIIAFSWPGATFLVMASIIGWYLLFDGMFNVFLAISTRHVSDLWWLSLILATGEVVIGIWAVGNARASIALLLVWVGVAALTRGFMSIFASFALHGADQRLRQVLG